MREILRVARGAERQTVLAVVGAGGTPTGVVDLELARQVCDGDHAWVIADDLSIPCAGVTPESDLVDTSALLQDRGLVQVPVVDAGAVIGYVGETELVRALAILRRSGT